MWSWGGSWQDRQVSRLMALLQLSHIVSGFFISSTRFIWWDIFDTSLVWKNKTSLFEKVGFMKIVLLCASTASWLVTYTWRCDWQQLQLQTPLQKKWRNTSRWGCRMGRRENETSLSHSAKMSLSLWHVFHLLKALKWKLGNKESERQVSDLCMDATAISRRKNEYLIRIINL